MRKVLFIVGLSALTALGATVKWFNDAAIPAKTALATNDLIAIQQTGPNAYRYSTLKSLNDFFGSVVNVKHYGAVGDGATDDTAAVQAAYDAIKAKGGKLYFPKSTGPYIFNLIVTNNNIGIEGESLSVDAGEALAYPSIFRPADNTRYVLTIGDDAGIVRGFHANNFAILGTDTNGINARGCLCLTGGVAAASIKNFALQYGTNTLFLENGANPVVSIRFLGDFDIRQAPAIENSRALTMIRRDAYGGYLTDVTFGPGHFHGATNGYVISLDGVALYTSQVYIDMHTNGPIWMTNGYIWGMQTTIDLNEVGAGVINASDDVKDPTRTFGGTVFGSPVIQLSDGFLLTNAVYSFSLTPYLSGPYLHESIYVVGSEDPYSTNNVIDLAGGEMRIRSTNFTLGSGSLTLGNNLYVKGGNATNAGWLSAVTVGGGLYLGALGDNQNVKLVPSGTGSAVSQGPFVVYGAAVVYSNLYVNTGTELYIGDSMISEDTEDGGLYFSAAGTNQDITLAPSGSGRVVVESMLSAVSFLPACKAAFSTNYTVTMVDSVLFCTGTNQLITLLDATNSTPVGRMVTIVSASTTGSVIVTNANGVQTVLGGLSVTVPSTNRLTVVCDGSNWW